MSLSPPLPPVTRRRGDETLYLPRLVTYPICHGSRAKLGTAPRQCKLCGGSGQKATHTREGGVTFHQITVCPDCHGQGVIVDKPCPECQGLGRIETRETLTVRIPLGSQPDQVLRIRGKGLPEFGRSGVRGGS